MADGPVIQSQFCSCSKLIHFSVGRKNFVLCTRSIIVKFSRIPTLDSENTTKHVLKRSNFVERNTRLEFGGNCVEISFHHIPVCNTETKLY